MLLNMSGDDRDIWDYFLKKEKEKEDDQEEKAEQTKRGKAKGSDRDYFLKHLDKYPPRGHKKEDLFETPVHRKKMNKKRPSASIDLHGMNIQDGVKKLENFLKQSQQKQRNLVLVVVGKGLHSEGGKSVLRDAIIHWLTNQGARFVSSFEKAPLSLGGGGAILVRVKRA